MVSDQCRISWWCLVFVLPTMATMAFDRERENVNFTVNHATSIGQSMYVLGNIPELGNNATEDAVKLRFVGGTTWTADVAIPLGTNYSYQFILRNDSVSQWSNPANGTAIGSVQQASTSPLIPAHTGKALYYHSGWNSVILNWRAAGSNDAYAQLTLTPTGQGRTANETRFRANGFGDAQRDVEFFFSEDGGTGRDPASNTYSTPLDAFFVQNGQLFPYYPSASISNIGLINGQLFSTILNENRSYQIFRPRGYRENRSKRYPVLYMHDGQNVFEFGPFGTWDADETARDMMAGGQIREFFIVAIDNSGFSRALDYIPPDDIVPIGAGFGGPGAADDYAAFVVNELKPEIDRRWRTLTDRDNTAIMGSSLGGVASLYFGWDYNSTFSRAAALSGSWWLPNFPARVASEADRDLRLYLDSGDSGTSNDGAWGTMNLRDDFLAKGRVLEGNLRHVVGYGDQHNEPAWARRLPDAYEFLFPITEAENPLANQIWAGDLNCDGVLTSFDIEPFIMALLDNGDYELSYGDCDRTLADCNHDGSIDAFDIEPFIDLLLRQ